MAATSPSAQSAIEQIATALDQAGRALVHLSAATFDASDVDATELTDKQQEVLLDETSDTLIDTVKGSLAVAADLLETLAERKLEAEHAKTVAKALMRIEQALSELEDTFEGVPGG